MAAFDPNYLVCSFRSPFADCKNQFNELADGIYFASIVTDEFCDHILGCIRDFDDERKNDAPESANSMHWNAIKTKQLGIDPLVYSFVSFFDREISRHILPERLRVPIDALHSYIVRYGQSWDQGLGFHVDDSFLTLNICLNDGFTGSELVFQGERCPIHVDTGSSAEEQICIEHKKGSMVVHPGKNRHYVNQISSGERYNLIIWCQSDTERDNWFDALKTGECLEFCGMRSSS
ncbi:MAG: hypothetical protein CBB68_04160 [Rhodospirillaceae bacterium TMED8]|nr:hypothetical protein [Magnetovibrio sp.]OUT51533.1 MAG: hypothetical protein CBB68_04160 [Rhodospirillaceae bacterium TMED8]|tara:strand:- start:549 stop:1250 length:702 start_codon:yes stop_codon:yes gene_type:complete